ncbi:MAG: bifunctional metallophosphatase/5'-nucleotidase [Bacteroidales bacterium]|nr:bifunctional metallophosphatase/5'-nucleotidase [Bacteroidales bacterium]MBR0539744.1 bifunctional metallophosphatase/5'-nucleotidase [Bacteroidales bacterium]
MKRLSKLMLATLAAMLFLASCQTKEQKIYVVSTNDMHANIDYFPQMAALIDSLRTVHPDLLLFGAGDNRSGNPINDRYAEPAKPMYELMNAVGFDLSTFGNHEWDGGVLALRDVLTWANFPFVCANVTFDDTLQMPNFKPYEVFERNGLKIGVIGGIQLGNNGLPDFHPKHADGSHFRPIAEVLPEYLPQLREECDLVFLLSHCGYEEDRETAAQFPELDAIFGGHSHTRVAETQLVNDVLVTQAEAKVKFVTLSTFTLKKGKVVDKHMELLSIKEFPHRNAEVQAMVDEYNNNDFFRTVVTTNTTPIESYESLGCLMTDAIRYTTGSDMGFQNPGGVRFDTLSARPVTLKDIFALDPFDNEIIAFTLSGQEIVNLIKSCFNTDHGPIYCSGCSYSFKVDDNGEMTDLKVKLENGKPLDLNANYNIVMNSYMSTVFDYEHEDDGHSTFRSSNELMLDYLADHPEIDYGNVSRVTEEE